MKKVAFVEQCIDAFLFLVVRDGIRLVVTWKGYASSVVHACVCCITSFPYVGGCVFKCVCDFGERVYE